MENKDLALQNDEIRYLPPPSSQVVQKKKKKVNLQFV
jgi:hypothetical protein